MSRYLVSFDPGTQAAGVALFDYQRLIDVLLIKRSGGYAKDRAVEIALDISNAIIEKWPFLLKHKDTRFVFEYPEFYSGGKTPGNGESILSLCIVLGGVALKLHELGFQKPKFIQPKKWKSQTKKEIMTERIEMCCAPCEIAVMAHTRGVKNKKIDHNVLDGVGIGFDALDRLPLPGTPIQMWLRTDEQLGVKK